MSWYCGCAWPRKYAVWHLDNIDRAGIGGLIQTICGVLLLNTGLNEQGAATLKIMGAQLSATGLGGILLSTSVMWAYFAYLSRPKYSSTTESRSVKRPDGSSETYEFSSKTQMAVAPRHPKSSDDVNTRNSLND